MAGTERAAGGSQHAIGWGNEDRFGLRVFGGECRTADCVNDSRTLSAESLCHFGCRAIRQHGFRERAVIGTGILTAVAGVQNDDDTGQWQCRY